MPSSQAIATRPRRAPWPADWRRTARRRLLAWYRRNARDLPWRRTHDAYAIWVSEIMLQQTQVATVAGYFPRFLKAFPSVGALAAADEDDVLRQWEGLGYYRRARQMHAAAKKIVAEHGGRFPRDSDTVRQLPGIGRYTAGAILSIAFDSRLPILEANTIRLLCRLLAYRGDTATSTAQQLLWQAAEALLPIRNSGEMNQALMELGSLICTPREPKCDVCPLQLLCPTRRNGLQSSIPRPRRKTLLEDRHEAAVVIERRGTVLLRKCGNDERWAGLWDFPRCLVAMGKPAANGKSPEQKLIAEVRRLTAVQILGPRRFATLRHGVTRYRIKLDGFTATYRGKISPKSGAANLRWVKLSDLDNYPLNTTGRKLVRLWQSQLKL